MHQPVREGDVLLGKYAVERVLGRGGMGVVLAARHLQLEERVAIKLMLPEVATSHEAVARFVREARLAARIKSEHVVRVSDVGTLEGGVPFMVMECLEGADLASLLAGRGRFPLDEATEYLLQAMEALAEAHSLGVVHRDLKPSNLFLTRRLDGTPLVKVLDFGISKAAPHPAGQSDGAATRTSALMGTPLYMSPEQLRSSRDVDARSDQWSLGVVLYELLAGSPPFVAPSLPEVCAMILEGVVPSLRASVPEIPEEVESIVRRCLALNRDARFADVSELAQALFPFAPKRARVSVARVAAALGAGAPVPSSDESVPTVASPGTNGAWVENPRVPAPNTKSRWLLTALGVGALAMAGVGALALGHRSLIAGSSADAAASQVVARAPPIPGESREPTSTNAGSPFTPSELTTSPVVVAAPSASIARSSSESIQVHPATARTNEQNKRPTRTTSLGSANTTKPPTAREASRATKPAPVGNDSSFESIVGDR